MGGSGKGKGRPEEGADAEHIGVSESESDPGNPRRTRNFPKLPSHAKIPHFFGGANQDPGDYKEWRREVAAIQSTYGIQDKDFAGHVFLATKGDARTVLWEVQPEHFADPTTFGKIMQLLDKEYDRPEWEKADHATEMFEKCRRVPGQRMVAYMRDMQRAYHRMLKEDQGTVISNTSMARRLLRRSGLTLEEQRQVLSSCGHDYDLDKIKDALRLTYGDTHKDDHRRPFHRGASSSSSNNHGNFNRKNFRKPFKRRFGTNAMDTVNEEYDETQE